MSGREPGDVVGGKGGTGGHDNSRPNRTGKKFQQVRTFLRLHQGALLEAVAILGLLLVRFLQTARLWLDGFRTLSDDDFARGLIALQFAAHPKLDPSGTSWLPLPFWMQGGWFLLWGPEWNHANGWALAGGMAGVSILYAASRLAGSTRLVSWTAVALWSSMTQVWIIGAAPIPEIWVAALAASSLLLLANPRQDIHWGAALAILAATLSRYETWPLALWFALGHGFTARTRPVLQRLAPVAVALLGPLAWIAWNAYAHGDPFHFHHRVTNFWQALHRQGGRAALDSLFTYPKLLLENATAAWFVLALLGGWFLWQWRKGEPEGAPNALAGLQKWKWAMGGLVVLLGGLVWGQLGGGAPTHHPERPLLAAWAIVWVVVVDGVANTVHELFRTRQTTEKKSLSRVVTVVGKVSLIVAVFVWIVAVGPAVSHEASRIGTQRQEESSVGAWLARYARGKRVEMLPRDYGYFAVLVHTWNRCDVHLSRPVDPRKGHEPGLLLRPARLERYLKTSGPLFALTPSGWKPPATIKATVRFSTEHWRVWLLSSR